MLPKTRKHDSELCAEALSNRDRTLQEAIVCEGFLPQHTFIYSRVWIWNAVRCGKVLQIDPVILVSLRLALLHASGGVGLSTMASSAVSSSNSAATLTDEKYQSITFLLQLNQLSIF